MPVIDCQKSRNRHRYVLNKIQRRILATVNIRKAQGWPTTTIVDLLEELGLTKRQAYYNVDKLLSRGLLENKDEFVYLLSLTEKGKDYLTAILGDSQKYGQSVLRFLDRAHKVTIVAKLAYRPEGVVPEGFVASTKSQKLKFKRPVLTYVDKEGHFTVQITEETISFCIQETYGVDSHHLVHTALSRCWGFSELLRGYGIKVKMPSYAVVDQHHALSNDILARFTARYDVHYKSDRLEFDKSVAPNEFELVHPQHATDDFLRMTDLFEAVIRGDISIQQLKELCSLLPQLRAITTDLQHQEAAAINVTGCDEA